MKSITASALACLLLSFASAQTSKADYVLLRCDHPGPRQVCLGATVLLSPSSWKEKNCKYAVTAVYGHLRYHYRHYPKSWIENYSYSVSPLPGEPCENSEWTDSRSSIQLRAPHYKDFRINDKVRFRGNCQGWITDLFEGGGTFVAADPGSPCSGTPVWFLEEGYYQKALPLNGSRLPEDLYP